MTTGTGTSAQPDVESLVLDLFPMGDEADDVTGVSLMKAAYSQETPSSPEVNQLFARLTEVNNLTLSVKTYGNVLR